MTKASSAPAIDGVLETCLYVDDMERARRFYETVLGLACIFSEERIAVYEIAPAAVLILFHRRGTLEPVETSSGTIPPHDGDGPMHYALAIAEVSLRSWRDHLGAHDIAVEGEMSWSQGGTSLYFRDPDGHLVELATPGLWRNYPRV